MQTRLLYNLWLPIYIHILQQRIPSSRKTGMPNEIQPSITLNNCVILPFFQTREDLWDTCDKQVSEMCVCSYLWEAGFINFLCWLFFFFLNEFTRGSDGLRGQQSVDFQENHFIKASRNCSALRPHRKPYSSSFQGRAPGVAAIRCPHLQSMSDSDGAFQCRHVSIGEGKQEGTSGRGTKKAKQVNAGGWGGDATSSKGLKFHFAEIHRCHGGKMCRFMRCGSSSFPQPASPVRKDVDPVAEWKQGTPSSPLRSSDALLFLLAPSPSPHLLPIWDYRCKRGVNKSHCLTLLRPKVALLISRQFGVGRFTQERDGDCFCLSS